MVELFAVTMCWISNDVSSIFQYDSAGSGWTNQPNGIIRWEHNDYIGFHPTNTNGAPVWVLDPAWNPRIRYYFDMSFNSLFPVGFYDLNIWCEQI